MNRAQAVKQAERDLNAYGVHVDVRGPLPILINHVTAKEYSFHFEAVDAGIRLIFNMSLPAYVHTVLHVD